MASDPGSLCDGECLGSVSAAPVRLDPAASMMQIPDSLASPLGTLDAAANIGTRNMYQVLHILDRSDTSDASNTEKGRSEREPALYGIRRT